MSDLMMRDPFFFFRVQQAIFLLQAADDALHCFLQFGQPHRVFPAPRRQQCRLIDDIGQVSAHEPRGHGRDDVQIGLGRQWHPTRVELENREPPGLVRPINQDMPVEPTGTQESRVQNLGPVRGGHQDDTYPRIEPIHLDQQLVQRLFPFLVRHRSHAAGFAQRVKFVDKDDARSFLLCLIKEVAHARRPHAHEHLHELRPADGKEWHACLARHRSREQGFSGSWRADQQNPLGDLAAQPAELLGRLQEFDDLTQLFLGLVHAGCVREGDLDLFLHVNLRLAPADRHEPALALPHAPEKEQPHTKEQSDRNDPGQQVPQERALDDAGHLDVVRVKIADEVRIFDPDRVEHPAFSRTGRRSP